MNRKLKSCHRISDYLNYIKLGTAKTLSVVNHIALTLARAGGGGDAAPIEKLMGAASTWVDACWVDRAEILHSLWGILCATFGETF